MRELSRRGHPIWLWLLALAPFVVLMARQWSWGCGLVCGDYAQYYLHADALLHGRSYSDIGYIYTQYNPWIGPPAQPPGFPLTLVPIFALFGQNPTAIKLLLQVSALVFLACAGLRIARTDGRLASAAVVMITGVALASMTAADSAISDLGFCALFWAFILIADRPGEWSKGRIATLTMLGLAAMSYRTAGAALIPAMALYAFTGENRRRAIAPLVIWIAVAAVLLLRLPVATAVLSHLELTPRSLLSNMARTLVLALRSSIFEVLLYPFPWRVANGAYHIVGTLVMAWGFVRMLRREWRSMSTALFIAYVVMLVLVPVRETRYSWPILPLFAWAFYEGSWRCARCFRGGKQVARIARRSRRARRSVWRLRSDLPASPPRLAARSSRGPRPVRARRGAPPLAGTARRLHQPARADLEDGSSRDGHLRDLDAEHDGGAATKSHLARRAR
jgi:hypothetical protein